MYIYVYKYIYMCVCVCACECVCMKSLRAKCDISIFNKRTFVFRPQRVVEKSFVIFRYLITYHERDW